MATRGHLGGLSLAVPDAVRLLGAAGFAARDRRDGRGGADGGRGRRRPPTRRWSSSPRGGATPCRPTRPACSRSPTSSSSTRLTAPELREARRDLEQMLDLSPPGVVAPRDRRDHGLDRRGGRRAVGGRRAPPGPPLDSARLAARLPIAWPRSCGGCCWRGTEVRIRELAGGEEFTSAVKALAAGELDPYQAADRLLGELTGRGRSGTVRPAGPLPCAGEPPPMPVSAGDGAFDPSVAGSNTRCSTRC